MNKYTNFNTLDSLDYLIPPIKKNHHNERHPTYLWESYYYRNNLALPINKQNKVKKRKREALRNIAGTQTYPSVAPPTSQYLEPVRQLFQEEYTICDVIERKLLRTKTSATYTHNKRCCKNFDTEVKPIITITVIPKSVETQTSKILNKRIYKRKLTNTVSNHESCLRSQNTYTSSGRRREKANEIKTSESENLSFKHQTKCNVPFQNFGQLFDSLEMDKQNFRRERHTDRKLYANQGDQKQINLGVKTFTGAQAHNKPPKLNLTSPKSRVRIFGRLGLTEDDQYVLNCAATLNDKPIPTNVYTENYAHRDRDRPDNSNQFYGHNYSTWNASTQNRQDINHFSEIHGKDVENKERFRKTESQGIQVNMCVSKNAHRTKSTKDKYVQCICQNRDMNISDDDETADVKKKQSPIVVISVYPKSEKGDIHPGHTIKIEQKETKSQKYYQKEYLIGSAQNSSETPTRENYPSRSPSPARPPSTKTTRHSMNESSKQINTNKLIRDKSPSKSPVRSRNAILKNGSEKNVQKLNRSRPPKQPYNVGQGRDIGDLTASRNLAKKALVDSYMSNLNNENVKNSKRKSFLVPKNDASKVTINIEGEREEYDLLFEQDRLNTHLAVRKTVKELGSLKKVGGNCHDSASMENLLNLSQDEAEELNIPISISPSKLSPLYKEKEDDLNFNRNSSQLCLRDSIEISHRRGSLSSSPKTSSKRSYNGTSNSSQSTKAQVKHYRGDECGIPDPNERDKEIRELLGILTGRKAKEIKESEQLIEEIFPVYKQCEGACCTDERSGSEKNLTTGISISKLPTGNRVENFFKKMKISKPAKNTDTNKKCADLPKCTEPLDTLEKTDINKSDGRHGQKMDAMEKPNVIKCPKSDENINKKDSKAESDKECKCLPKEFQNELLNKTNVIPNQWQARKPQLMCPHCKEPKPRSVKEPVCPQPQPDGGNLVLARNIQVFIELEQFKKEKPIMLSRKQYDKVKKTIQSTISKKKSNDKQRCYNYSMVSVGDVKVKSKLQKSRFMNREVQTDGFEAKTCSFSDFLSSLESFERHEASCRSYSSIYQGDGIGTPQLSDTSLILKENVYNTIDKESASPRIARSSVEVRYASVAFLKHVAYSSPVYNKAERSIKSSSANNHNSASLHTLFKGFKKSVTPNLGTSAFSLCSETDSRLSDKSKRSQFGRERKYKKPLLQRLVSCLIMRSTRISEMKIGRTPQRGPLTANTSTDSYHFSTSFAGFELPSSMYDTSASFYSNHTVLPLNKMKRGFFSSVRGFLTNRRN